MPAPEPVSNPAPSWNASPALANFGPCSRAAAHPWYGPKGQVTPNLVWPVLEDEVSRAAKGVLVHGQHLWVGQQDQGLVGNALQVG